VGVGVEQSARVRGGGGCEDLAACAPRSRRRGLRWGAVGRRRGCAWPRVLAHEKGRGGGGGGCAEQGQARGAESLLGEPGRKCPRGVLVFARVHCPAARAVPRAHDSRGPGGGGFPLSGGGARHAAAIISSSSAATRRLASREIFSAYLLSCKWYAVDAVVIAPELNFLAYTVLFSIPNFNSISSCLAATSMCRLLYEYHTH